MTELSVLIATSSFEQHRYMGKDRRALPRTCRSSIGEKDFVVPLRCFKGLASMPRAPIQEVVSPPGTRIKTARCEVESRIDSEVIDMLFTIGVVAVLLTAAAI